MIHHETGAAMTKEMATSFKKSFESKPHDTLYTGAEYFPYSDFLGTLFGNKSGQSKESQTGNQNRESGKDDGDFSYSLFGSIHFIKGFIKKMYN